ncbi:MAG: class I SAM-dependent RNA methyltransferase [Anaerolineales bacterium]
MMNKPKITEVEITSMAFGGAGVGRLEDGRTAFVPFVLPDERVAIAITEEKAHYVLTDLIEVLRPAPNRIKPSCPHFGECGGCHYQHTTYENQLHIKSQILRDQLQRIGGIKQPPEILIVPSPIPWEYRNTLQFHLTPNGNLGFQHAKSTATLEIQECRLAQAALQGLWRQIAFEPDLDIERIHLRCGYNDEIMMTIESTNPQAPNITVEDLPISVVHVHEDDAIVLAGSDHLWVEVLGRLFHLSPTAFFQVNNRVAEKIVQYLLSEVELDSQMTLIDGYCGGGLYSAFLAAKVGRVIGIESSASACRDFEINLDEFDHVELYQAAVEDVLPYLNIKADILLLDPPRSGLTKPVRLAISNNPPKQLVYISCDPSTLSRDAKYLQKAGLQITKLAFFDMFPQTYHIESVSIWRNSS